MPRVCAAGGDLTEAKPKIRCYYWGEGNPIANLGDLLTPMLLQALGYVAVPRDTPDSEVVNPGRCLLVIGSLLTESDLAHIGYAVDVWGCGWKGRGTQPSTARDTRWFAVRGPHTAACLGLPPDVPLGDPALLVPRLLAISAQPHGKTLLVPHIFRLKLMPASDRLSQTGCDEILSPLVLRRPWLRDAAILRPRPLGRMARLLLRHGIGTGNAPTALRRIAGARFVLTGSLHGAILAQAFGVPWACLDDGYIDAPAKWNDWGAYLGIDIEAVRTLREGERWWKNRGHAGKVRDLEPVLAAFPYRQAITVGEPRKLS